MKVNILGQNYKVIVEDFHSPGLEDSNRHGYCFFDAKEIHIADLDTDEEWKDEKKSIKKQRRNKILRHEVIHAFLFESGLAENTHRTESWAFNEEIVDWIAIQFPKIFKAFQECNCL